MSPRTKDASRYLSVYCPSCGAPAGEACDSKLEPGKKLVGFVHPKRVRRYNRLHRRG